MEQVTPLPWQQTLWAQLVAWRERLPHALLLHGPRGVGKRQLLKAFAQLLLCETAVDDSPCGRCAGCHLWLADNHPDLRWLTPAGQMPERDDAASADAAGDESGELRSARTSKTSREIVIDQVRKTGEFLSLTAHRGGRQVVLLIPAEALNGPAANALLKVLEEPPAGSVFLVISDELDAVLPTIRSRCILLSAPVPTAAQALAWLQSRGVDHAATRLAEAGGAPVGIGDESALDDRATLDSATRDVLFKLLGRGPALTGAEVASAVPKDIAVAPAIRLLQRWGWDLLAERLAGRVRYYPQHQRQFATVARALEPKRVVEWAAALAQMQAVSDHPLNGRLVIEGALLSYIDALRTAGTNPPMTAVR